MGIIFLMLKKIGTFVEFSFLSKAEQYLPVLPFSDSSTWCKRKSVVITSEAMDRLKLRDTQNNEDVIDEKFHVVIKIFSLL